MHREPWTHSTLCFTCGQPVSDPPVLNELPSGEPCPACRERALDAAPALLPFAEAGREGEVEAAPEQEEPAQQTPQLPFGELPEPA